MAPAVPALAGRVASAALGAPAASEASAARVGLAVPVALEARVALAVLDALAALEAPGALAASVAPAVPVELVALAASAARDPELRIAPARGFGPLCFQAWEGREGTVRTGTTGQARAGTG